MSNKLNQPESMERSETINQPEGMEQSETINHLESMERPETINHLESMERLETINHLESMERLETINQSESMKRSETFSDGNLPVFTAEPVGCSVRPLKFDEELCIGCGSCASVCQVDILVPSVEKGRHPIVMYPGECYYCGSCVMACPVEGALKLQHPLMNQTRFIDIIPEPAAE